MIVATYYVAGGAVFGALLGAAMARKRGGRGTDMAHWAAVLAIAFALVGLFASVIIARNFTG